MNKAYIYFNDKNNKEDSGEGGYVLVFDDNVIGNHFCSNRSFANHDLTIWKIEELEKNNIDEVISNGEVVWSKKDLNVNEKTNDNFEMANVVYEAKYCK